jgi:hypothetical protein
MLHCHSVPKDNGSRQCLFIIGMGRSGTSALAGAPGLLGVDLGPTLLPPDDLNTKGYLENPKVVAINNTVLKQIGSYHGDFKPMDGTDWRSPSLTRCADEIVNVIVEDFRHSRLFALKDPRLCRFGRYGRLPSNERACPTVQSRC